MVIGFEPQVPTENYGQAHHSGCRFTGLAELKVAILEVAKVGINRIFYVCVCVCVFLFTAGASCGMISERWQSPD